MIISRLKRCSTLVLVILIMGCIQFFPLAKASAEENVTFSGKMLLNGAAPGDYYQSYVDGQFKGMIVAGPAGGILRMSIRKPGNSQ